MTPFAQRLRILIGERSVSAFARQVDMSESLIRKYLGGSEPSLSRAAQIADKTNTSLHWLATGLGSRAQKLEEMDDDVLQKALAIAFDMTRVKEISMDNRKLMKLVFVLYHHLYISRQQDGYMDLRDATLLASRMTVELGL